MKRSVIRKICAVLLTTVVCSALCTGFTADAQDADTEAKQPEEQIEQTEDDLEEEEGGVTEVLEASGIDEGEEAEAESDIEETKQEYEVTEQPVQTMETKAITYSELNNPVIVKDSSMEALQNVTWDCVWFGNYPQAEVITKEMSENYTAIDSMHLNGEEDFVVSDDIYNQLQCASGWDSNNEIIIGGSKYRRMKREDARNQSGRSSGVYKWEDDVTWHYFKYEPIKWRVLKVDGNKALLLSDWAVDAHKYSGGEKREPVTWETSLLRSWMNSAFADSAFTAEEKSAIYDTELSNDANMTNGTSGGNGTNDKIFLLSESDMYNTDTAVSYGFAKDEKAEDEARRCKGSTYAKAMGMNISSTYNENCWWWLRSPGEYTYFAAEICMNGSGFSYGMFADGSYGMEGVRPALNLDLSRTVWSQAGNVCSKVPGYKISYDANGGSNAPDTQTKYHGITLTLTYEKPIREGYTFLGWSPERTATSAVYTPGKTYTGNNPITLYAVWRKLETYTVTYDANGGSGGPPPQIKTEGITLNLSSIKPIREGCTFLGWSESSTSLHASYEAGGTYSSNGNLTLYAVWQVPVYTVTYHMNGGSGTLSSQTKSHGVPLTLWETVPVQKGYTFLGWSAGGSSSDVTYRAGGSYMENSSVDLYAVWEPITYTVTYDANGGSGAPSQQKKIYGVTLILSDKEPVREGYTFLGWSVKSVAEYAGYCAGANYTGDKSVYLYAVWKKNTNGTENNGGTTGTGDSSGNTGTGNSSGNPVTAKKQQSITTSALSYTKAIGSKAFSLGTKTDGDGKLAYTSSNKKVATVTSAGKVTVKAYGTATVTIKAPETQNYKSATKKISVKVIPKKLSLKTVKSPSKKKMEISWKKDSTVTGYEIYVSPKKNFSSGTIKRTYKKNTVKKIINGLKSKKTYYVKIRAYKTVGKNKYYGKWSAVKKVKVK